MGQKQDKVDAGQEKVTYAKREKPVAAETLKSNRAAPTDQTAGALDLSIREYDNYRSSVESYSRALKRESNVAAKNGASEIFNSAWYTTRVKEFPPQGEEKRAWQVTTVLNAAESKCIYQNKFFEDGEIVAISNFHHEGETATHAVTKEVRKTGEITLSNSNVMVCQLRYLTGKNLPVQPPECLTRHEVSNVQTCDTARACLLISAEMTAFPASWDLDWSMDDNAEAPCAEAMLGTPNGTAAVYLVKDWGAELGITGIKSVEVVKPAPITTARSM